MFDKVPLVSLLPLGTSPHVQQSAKSLRVTDHLGKESEQASSCATPPFLQDQTELLHDSLRAAFGGVPRHRGTAVRKPLIQLTHRDSLTNEAVQGFEPFLLVSISASHQGESVQYAGPSSEVIWSQ